jgi:hypothetical protein
VSKNALRKSMAGYRTELKKAYADSDAILHDDSQDWPGADTLRLIQALKKKASDKRHKEDAKWKTENAPELKDMTAYINAKKADPRSTVRNPHPGIHMKRVEHLHEQTIHVTATELEDIATGVDKLVKKYRVTDERTNEPPMHAAAGRNEFYIFSILRYMAREKYRYVQAIEKWLTHMPADERTPKQKEYMHLFSKISSLKKHMEEARENLKALSAGKTRKPRPPRPALPDDNNPPKQQPVHHVKHKGG